MSRLRVAYILLHFPYLTETFVAEEIRAIRAQGVEVEIISLLEAGGGPVQTVSAGLLPHCWYAPGLASLRLWQAQFYYLFRTPALYFTLLFLLLRCPYPKERLTLLAKRLVIFLKAVAAAHRLRGRKIDLLHAHFAWLPGAAAWVCARLLGLPFTVTAHAYDLFASPDLLPVAAGAADHVIAISEYNRRFLVEQRFCNEAAVTVIHCGVDYAQLAALAGERRARAAGAPIRILSVGSLNAKKGHEYLIEACRLLDERQLPFTCTIIGGGGGELLLRRQIERHGLHERVQLCGARSQEEVLPAYRDHDLFVLAAVVAPNGDQDGIPVVMMEAGAFGLPLLSTQVSGIPELVQHERTGLLVPPKDAEALADAIDRLAADPALRQEYGSEARLLVQTEFNVAVNAQRLVTMFQAVIAARGAKPGGGSE
jgi:glycosyltransferase involved in cell wall biosynthesis